MLIFRNLIKAPKGKFPPGMCVLGSKGGTMKREFMKDQFIRNIFKKRSGSFFVVKKHCSLWTKQLVIKKEAYPRQIKLNTDLKYIDSGMTPLLQWLDVVINKPFKDMLKDFWEEWLDTGRAEFTKIGNRKRVSYELIANWVMEASNRVATDEKILTGFRQCGYIDYGKVENLHSKLHMTIKNREVPHDLIE